MTDYQPPRPTVVGQGGPSESALAEVSSALWRVRELLDLLTFKLETEQVLVAAGRARWLGRATHEVEIVLEEIKRAELRRAVELDAVAGPLGLGPDASLRELAEAAPPPWDDVFSDHRATLVSATAEISALAEANKELLDSSYRAVQAALGLAPDVSDGGTYNAAGAATDQPPPRLFDQST